MKRRVQHPAVHEREDRGTSNWYFRYWEDVPQPDGKPPKSSRRFHTCGPSKGKDRITKTRAEIIRDNFLAKLVEEQEQMQAQVPPPATPPPATPPPATPAAPSTRASAVQNDPGQIIFGRLAEVWKTNYVTKVAAGKHMLALPTRENYLLQLKNHILPKWQNARLCELRPAVVLEWLQDESGSWNMMSQLRGIMCGIITKAIEWELIPYTYANPLLLVKLPKKWEVREKRILSDDETARVFARLTDPHLLICETCLDTSTRISEATGLMIKHVDLDKGAIKIVQRAWRDDIGDPKTDKSKRTLALGALVDRYRTWIAGLERKGPNNWVFPGHYDPTKPRCYQTVLESLKTAAAAEGLDFPGFGLHSLRRANITNRQEVGGSAIEASKIAGHSKIDMTGEYTIVQMKRQQELTRRMQERRIKAEKRAKKVVEIKKEGAAA